MDKAQKGFTLIELVVVITILGILAAFAFPRFAALEVEARIATIKGLEGSVRSAATLAHSLDLVGATPILMEGKTISMTNGYPATAAGGIDNTLVDITGFTYSMVAGPPQVATFETDGGTAGTCTVVFAEPLAAGDAPIVTVTTTGC